MNRWEYLALALELWTVIGILGLLLSLVRRERRKLVQGIGSLVGAWTIYLGALLFISHRQPERRIPLGSPACFHTLCYTVERAEELSGFPARNHSRLLRVTVRIDNRGTSAASEDLAPALRDSSGRVWLPTDGVSGNPLSARVLPGGSIVSQPVFQLNPETTGLTLLLAHPRRSQHQLVLTDPESLGHRPQLMLLNP